ncbi:BEL1-like homeodomain protein 1 [Benincasa hispida]|uniref:BEL1-like homeodomain protein 1 n=1 Tax=Benincasa hispida TaxID=102211 RepID=UPI001901CBDC|nr:BEL1-like homeodomain protein 1 [Benincasa hispida]XP_038900649.1 BEL1-like homeodomain protein 1 [Benincasa hispida]
MATYFHGGSEIQANSDGIHTLYLMNPNYVPYSDTHSQTPPNMLFLNPSTHALNPSTLSHAPPSNNHFVGIPLPTTDAPRPSYHYNLWTPMDQQTAHHGISADSADLTFRRPTTQQGLSLSLSSQQSLYRTLSAEQDIQGGGGGGGGGGALSGDEIRVSGNSPTSVSVVSSGITGVQSVILGSKYLKAAQELLDEVVHVGKGNFKTDKGEGTKDKMKMKKESTATIGGDPSGGGSETTSKAASELSTAQRQDLQMKKAKLIGMLDEVEQKYRQYHQQMQGVVSCFEQAAGLGSAKSYASLALATISKQFRCLKDAICAQIKATGKSLGEEDNWLGSKIEGSSRLRYVDHHLRQQRALQQLGMIQHNTWRPQRGLPERAVSVLRAWLFEHFLHPYPKDSDKIILAKQTGLTRSQVSNWFINARVRLWKPMVEEMYLEEIKEQEQNGDSQDMIRGSGDNHHHQNNNNNNSNNDPQYSKTENLMNNHPSHSSISSSSILGIGSTTTGGFNLVPPSSGNNILSSPKKPRTTTAATTTSTATNNNSNAVHDHHRGSFGNSNTYPVGEIGSTFNSELLTPRFHANGVSLTLALPHNNNSDHLSLSANQPNYHHLSSNPNLHLGRSSRLDITNHHHPGPPDFSDVNPAAPPPHSAYDHVEMQTTKRFAAQLLPDFVA